MPNNSRSKAKATEPAEASDTSESVIMSFVQRLKSEDVPFNDKYDTSSEHFKEMINCHVGDQEVTSGEGLTRGQNRSEDWWELKRTKLTVSNLKTAVTRCKE